MTKPENLIGKKVLLAVFYFSHDGCIESREQFLGEILYANQQLIGIRKPDGKEMQLPFVPYTLNLASRGSYTLEGTNKVINDPDYTSQWKIFHDNEPDGSYGLAPVHPDPYVSRMPRPWTVEYRYDEEFLRSQIDEIGEEYIGKTVILGITDQDTKKQRQYYGVIAEISFQKGIILQVNNGSIQTLPPDISLLRAAIPGIYTLHHTGETVVNPDFISYVVRSHPNKEIR